MQVGESRSVKVSAREPWNDTKVEVVSGAVYRFAATGHWLDLFVWTDADGYDSMPIQRPYEPRRRVASQKWFSLVGTIGRHDDSAFVIGKGITWTASATGRLFAYANDVPEFYFNNFWHLTMSVERLA